jgi:hypothetical protein
VSKLVNRTSELPFLATSLWAVALISAAPDASHAAVLFGAPPHSVPLTVNVQAGGDVVAADVNGAPGDSIALKIEIRGQGDANDIYSIGGLPPGVKLSAGGPYNQLWIVKRKHLEELVLTTPQDMEGAFKLTITRAPTPTRPELKRSFIIRIQPQKAPVQAVVSERSNLPATSSLSQARREPPPVYRRNSNDDMLFTRASDQFKRGDVAGARAIFEFLVSKGDADAAFAMGETYDSVALNQLVIEGVTADDDKAREWYSKARQLGHIQAEARLNALESMR